MADGIGDRTRKLRLNPEVILEKRKPLTPAQRKRLWEEKGHCCLLCSEPIAAGERWIDEHFIPLGLGGTNEWKNRWPVHWKCASEKTRADLSKIAKSKRVAAKHRGLERGIKKAIPGGRGSQWKRKLNGQTVKR